MKKYILLLFLANILIGCTQEAEQGASAAAQITASDVQNAHAETVHTLDQLITTETGAASINKVSR